MKELVTNYISSKHAKIENAIEFLLSINHKVSCFIEL